MNNKRLLHTPPRTPEQKILFAKKVAYYNNLEKNNPDEFSQIVSVAFNQPADSFDGFGVNNE